MDSDFAVFYHLAVALAIGLLIGTERGWQKRDAGEGNRIAGLRTFGLLGLLGGVGGVLAVEYGMVLAGFMFLGVAAVLATVYAVNLDQRDDIGITSQIASLLTWLLGLEAGAGKLVIAAACAVIMAFLLSYKSLLHGWLYKLERLELKAGLQLLLHASVPMLLAAATGLGFIIRERL